MKSILALFHREKHVATALKHHQTATSAAAQMAVAAALCGIELKTLKKELGHGEWEDFFAKHFAPHGLSDRTSRRYMALADGLKGKLLKSATVADLKLLDTAPSELPKADQVALTNLIKKSTDGKTISDLYSDFGITKKPQGSGARGGDTTSPDKPASKEETAAMIAEGHKLLAQGLITTLEEGLLDGWWNSCDKATRKKLHGLLVDVQSKVKETLA